VKVFEVANVSLSGFERRPDNWELRLKLPAGTHEFVVAFPRQFDGLPPRFGGPNPSRLPEPAPRPQAFVAGPGQGPVDNRPGKLEERRLAAERAKEQALHPTWDGLSVNEFDILGPYDYVRGPSPESLRKIFTCGDRQSACMRNIVSDLATRAFRRPLTENEINPLLQVAEAARRRSGSFERGVEVAIAAILVSPDFLFRIERSGPASGDTASAIGPHDLASRLSYFLWSSMPDEELLGCAECSIWASTYAFFSLYANADGFTTKDAEALAGKRPKAAFDRWLLSRLHRLVSDVTDDVQGYDTCRAGRPICSGGLHIDSSNFRSVSRNRIGYSVPDFSPVSPDRS